jgi:hypothetical protein
MTQCNRSPGDGNNPACCVTEEQVDAALELQMKGDARKIGEIFQAQKLCDSSTITAALAEQFDMEMVDLEGVEATPEALNMVSQEDCSRDDVCSTPHPPTPALSVPRRRVQRAF